MEKHLKEVYYDPNHPAGFGGVDAVFQAVRSLHQNKGKVSKRRVKKWLSEQSTYTLHKPVRRRFKRNKVLVYGIDHQWQIDLIDVQPFSRQNNSYRYILICIDVFSKYVWAVPLKDKRGPSVVDAFKKILKDGRKPHMLQSDKGTEFLNKHFQDLLKENDIYFFTTNNEGKCQIVERVIRTILSKMYKYFTYKNTRKYTDVLDEVISAYNNKHHSSIGRPPIQVNENNEKDVWNSLYGDTTKTDIQRQKFKVGDKVRLSMLTQPFRKGYLPNWTEEIFTITHVINRKPIVYKLADFDGDEIKGTFYNQELQKVAAPRNDVYKIERILGKRRRGNVTEYLVKWLGYPDKFNSYVTDIKSIV